MRVAVDTNFLIALARETEAAWVALEVLKYRLPDPPASDSADRPARTGISRHSERRSRSCHGVPARFEPGVYGLVVWAGPGARRF